MFCHNCGMQLDDGLKFCLACGTSVSVPLPAQNAVTTPDTPPVPLPPVPNAPSLAPYNTARSATAYQQNAPFQQQINIHLTQQATITTKWATPRTVIGIITIGLFFLFQFQSCAASVGESLKSISSETTGTSGATGYVVSFFFLIAGVISIACRKSKGGSIAAGIVYALCGLVLVNQDSSYFRDLEFYCFLSFIFAGIMIIGGALQESRGSISNIHRP